MAVTLASIPLTTESAPQHEKFTTTAKKSARHVSFNKALNAVHENTQWSFEECRHTWYTAFEFKCIKENAQKQAKEIWKSERRNTSEDSYSKTLLRVYDLCCDAQQETNTSILSESDEASLATYIGKANTRSGLEKLCIREIAHDKRFRRGEIATAILTVQATHQHGSARSQAELLRRSSETITRASRLFARHMAMALETSLQE
eukprot:scaffold44673_cov229-Amphora_coffeaeformis.AAC.4